MSPDPTHRPPIISVIGAGAATAAEEQLAYQVGKGIAERGGVVLTGGLGGVMAHASRGACEAGGLTIGVLPTASARDANPWVTLPLVTGMGEARNVIVASSAAAVIAVGGALGTLSEIAYALRRGIPVIGLGSWELDPDRSGGRRVVPAATPAEAVERAWNELFR